jgi:hypothetical protein
MHYGAVTDEIERWADVVVGMFEGSRRVGVANVLSVALLDS